jgi:membrane glycosyltransferase
VLSDTQDPDIAAQEEAAMLLLCPNSDSKTPIFYRRRATNVDRKTGNLAQWITTWGGGYEAMLPTSTVNPLNH